MINLRMNKDNLVVLTLAERTTLINPYYTFLIKSKETQGLKFFNAVDISSSPNVYNKFIFTLVNTDEDINFAKLILKAGEYQYEVYEKTMAGDFVIGECEKPIEKGIMTVRGNSETVQSAITTVEEVGVFRG